MASHLSPPFEGSEAFPNDGYMRRSARARKPRQFDANVVQFPDEDDVEVEDDPEQGVNAEFHQDAAPVRFWPYTDVTYYSLHICDRRLKRAVSQCTVVIGILSCCHCSDKKPQKPISNARGAANESDDEFQAPPEGPPSDGESNDGSAYVCRGSVGFRILYSHVVGSFSRIISSQYYYFASGNSRSCIWPECYGNASPATVLQ